MSMTPKPLAAILASGLVASATSAVALGVASRLEGKGALRPLNATSHWLRGDKAADRDEVDLAHTAVGCATHLAATLFWAAAFEGSLRLSRRMTVPGQVPLAAALTTVVAVVADYEFTPARFTPGWEHALTKTSMGFGYGAMAVGLAFGRRLASSFAQ